MNVLDIFSGIGGFSLGLERAGMKTVAFCENDKFCRKVLKKHWPKVPIFDDVKNIRVKPGYLIADEDGCEGLYDNRIDVICGGFPCQDISVAGKKEGIHGKRSGLWKEFKRLIKEVKPRYAIIENVANLRANGLETVLGDLAELGYDGEWHIIPARAVGAPHLRERIWIIAWRGNEGEEKAHNNLQDLPDREGSDLSKKQEASVLFSKMLHVPEESPYKYQGWRSGAFVHQGGANAKRDCPKGRLWLAKSRKKTGKIGSDSLSPQREELRTVSHKTFRLWKAETTPEGGHGKASREGVGKRGDCPSYRLRHKKQQSRESPRNGQGETWQNSSSVKSPDRPVSEEEVNKIRSPKRLLLGGLDGFNRSTIRRLGKILKCQKGEPAYPDQDRRKQHPPLQTGNQREGLPPKRASGEGAAAHANGEGLEGLRSAKRVQKEYPTPDGPPPILAHSHDFRFWQPYASEEEKSFWWAKTTARFRDWWQAESGVRRVLNGLPSGLERNRKARIKALGNSLLPQIPELIGRAIMDYEERRAND